MATSQWLYLRGAEDAHLVSGCSGCVDNEAEHGATVNIYTRISGKLHLLALTKLQCALSALQCNATVGNEHF